MATLGTIFTSPPAGWVRYESHNMTMSGGFTSLGNSSWSSNMLIYANALGAMATVSGVNGVTGLRVIGGGSVAGTGDVYLNDVKVGSFVETYSGASTLVFELLGLDPNTEYTLKIVTTNASTLYIDAIDWEYSCPTVSTPAAGWARIINSNTSVLKYSAGTTQFIYNSSYSGNRIVVLETVGSNVSLQKPIKGITGFRIIGYKNMNNVSPRKCSSKVDVYLNGVYNTTFSTIAPIQVNHALYAEITGLDVDTEYNIEIRNVEGDSCVIGYIDLQTSQTLMLAGLSISMPTPESGWVRYDDADETLFNYSNTTGASTAYPTLYNSTYHNTSTVDNYFSTKKIKGITALRIFGQDHTTYGFSKIYVNDILHGYMYQYASTTIRTSFDYEITGLDINTDYVIKIECTGDTMIIDCMDFMGSPTFSIDKGSQVPLAAPFAGWSRIHVSNPLMYRRSKTKYATTSAWESTAGTDVIGGAYHNANAGLIGDMFTRKTFKGITAISIIGSSGPTQTGSVDVYLNDEKVGTITPYEIVIMHRKILFYKDGLDANTEYTLRLEVTSGPVNINAIEGLGTFVYDTTLPLQYSAYSATASGWSQYVATSDKFAYFSDQWEVVNSSMWLNGGKVGTYLLGQCFYTKQFKGVSGIRIYMTGYNASSKATMFLNGEFIETADVTSGVTKGLVCEILNLDPSKEYQFGMLNHMDTGYYVYHMETLGEMVVVSDDVKYPIIKSVMLTIPPGWTRKDLDDSYIEVNGSWSAGNYSYYYGGGAKYTSTLGSYKQVLVKNVSEYIIYNVGNTNRVDGSTLVYVDDILVDCTMIEKTSATVGALASYWGTLDPSKAHKIKIACGNASYYTQPDAIDIKGVNPTFMNLNAIGVLVKNKYGYIMKYNNDTKVFDATTDKVMMDDKYVYSKTFVTDVVMPLVMELPALDRYTLEVYDLSNVTKLGVLYEGENWVSNSIFKDELNIELFGNVTDRVISVVDSEKYLPNDVIYGTSFFAHKMVDDVTLTPNVKEICDNVPMELKVMLPIVNDAVYSKDEFNFDVFTPNSGIEYKTLQDEYIFIQGISDARADFFLSTVDAEGTKFRVKDITANIDDFIEIKFDTSFDTIVCPDFLTVNSDNSAISGILIVSGTFIITGAKEGSNFTVNLTVNKLKRIM